MMGSLIFLTTISWLVILGSEKPSSVMPILKTNQLIILLVITFAFFIIMRFFIKSDHTNNFLKSQLLIQDPAKDWVSYNTDRFSFKYPPNYCLKSEEQYLIKVYSNCDKQSIATRSADIIIDGRLSGENQEFGKTTQIADKTFDNPSELDIDGGVKIFGKKKGEDKLSAIAIFNYYQHAITVEDLDYQSNINTFTLFLKNFKLLGSE
jgi:hypothetical protein